MPTTATEITSQDNPRSDFNPSQPARIEDLKFVIDRLPFLASQQDSVLKMRRAHDRTTNLVRLWFDTQDQLRLYRPESLSFCEARPGKGDTVSLVIVDRERFDTHQARIKEQSSFQTQIEEAIRKLDALGAGWYDDLLSQVQIFGGTEYNERTRISSMTSAYIQRHRDMTPEEVLELPEVKKEREEMEQNIARSAEKLKFLRPQLQEMETLLSSCRC